MPPLPVQIMCKISLVDIRLKQSCHLGFAKLFYENNRSVFMLVIFFTLVMFLEEVFFC